MQSKKIVHLNMDPILLLDILNSVSKQCHIIRQGSVSCPLIKFSILYMFVALCFRVLLHGQLLQLHFQPYWLNSIHFSCLWERSGQSFIFWLFKINPTITVSLLIAKEIFSLKWILNVNSTKGQIWDGEFPHKQL